MTEAERTHCGGSNCPFEYSCVNECMFPKNNYMKDKQIEKNADRYVSKDILRSHDISFAKVDYMEGAKSEWRKNWVGVDVRKPIKGHNVIVWNDVKGKWKIDRWVESGWYDSPLNEITHWMEVKPPK